MIGSLTALQTALQNRFGFSDFRAYQKEVCLSAYESKDVLLVMPTGAGKSLCYQLPTIAHQNARTLVISPLVALIEDQTQKLARQRIPAACIHAGIPRGESQEICRQWRDGHLKFLYIAPERLAIPGFFEFLEANKPTTVAIDEAHCISCWGHDFRPEYRMLGQRLSRLRPANTIAVTATATPLVQKDIIEQLNLQNPEVYIRGFKRENIGIEVISIPPGSRVEATLNILGKDQSLPAIVYTPTRKIAEQFQAELAGHINCDVFHAGLPLSQRKLVQERFMSGDCDVMVATIAFGMGVDKSNIRTVIHTALPSSMESYYQEIGRAGRDGAFSKAVLLYSPIDLKTHEYFFELNYPLPEILETIQNAIPKSGITRDGLHATARWSDALLTNALEKLWIHEGLRFDSDGTIHQNGKAWRTRYTKQRNHKYHQLDGVLRFAKRDICRMQQLLEHFGDPTAVSSQCSVCDVCLGTNRNSKGLDFLSDDDKKLQILILKSLIGVHARTFGQIFKTYIEPMFQVDRRHTESLILDLEAKHFVKQRSDSFEKDGRTVDFKWIELTTAGRTLMHEQGHASSVAEQLLKLKKKKPKKKRR